MSTHNEDLSALIGNAVSSTKELVLRIDKALEGPQDVCSVSRETLEAIRMVMTRNANLVTELFDERQDVMHEIDAVLNQEIMKQVDEILRK